jgi:WhiB family redox-sensing transcriptional regulator
MKFPEFVEHGSPPCSQVDPEAYFPESGQGITPEARIAKRICKACPYIDPCLEWAVENNELGIWGGTTAFERRGIRQADR